MESRTLEGWFRVAMAGLALLLFLSLASSFGPPWMTHQRLADRVREECRMATLPGRTEDEIRERLARAARDLELNEFLDPSEVKVQKRSSEIRIRLHYQRPVRFLGRTIPWNLTIDITRPLF